MQLLVDGDTVLQRLVERGERSPASPERRTGLCRYCRSIASGRRSRSCRTYPDRIYQALVVKRSGIREVREVCPRL
jgi:hypothetical protein